MKKYLPLLLFSALCLAAGAETSRVVDAVRHHLGDTDVKDWAELTTVAPDGTEWARMITATGPNATSWTVQLTIRDANSPWRLLLNGAELHQIPANKDEQELFIAIPAGRLRAGDNELHLVPTKKSDDIIFGPVTLHEATPASVMKLGEVQVQILDDASGKPMPARVAIFNSEGQRPILYDVGPAPVAVRQGIVCCLGIAHFSLKAGTWRIAAVRGMEWSMPEQTVEVVSGKTANVTLRLRQEVLTLGFIASDTHLHTLTFSGHGDASLQERIVALAADGVELAIATDHNHHTDYRPMQKELKTEPWYSSVVGNEVTTKLGHFNAFPYTPEGAVPDHKENDWVKLVADMRAKGASTVILNHPRWPAIDRGPFAAHGLDRTTGARATGQDYTFDAVEIINSTALLDDPMYTVTDWLALLKHGDMITAVGSSDSHTVKDPAGQGRTYLASTADEPSRIDTEAAATALRQGRCSASLGIFANFTIDKYGMGDVVPMQKGRYGNLIIRSPSWVKPRKWTLYLNGEVHASGEIAVTDAPCTGNIRIPIPPVTEDSWLVAVIIGDPVTHPAWPTLKPYTMAVTNPIYLDADHNGTSWGKR